MELKNIWEILYNIIFIIYSLWSVLLYQYKPRNCVLVSVYLSTSLNLSLQVWWIRTPNCSKLRLTSSRQWQPAFLRASNMNLWNLIWIISYSNYKQEKANLIKEDRIIKFPFSMALFIIYFHHFVSFFSILKEVGWWVVRLALPLPPSNKSDWCLLWCDVSSLSSVLTYPDLVQDLGLSQQTCSVLSGVQGGGNTFSGQPGDTWWWANGTEISNISTVPDYKYLTKISQNFLNILVETYTSVCQSVKTSRETELSSSVNRSEGRASLELRQLRVNAAVLLLSAHILHFCSGS